MIRQIPARLRLIRRLKASFLFNVFLLSVRGQFRRGRAEPLQALTGRAVRMHSILTNVHIRWSHSLAKWSDKRTLEQARHPLVRPLGSALYAHYTT